MGHVLKKEGLQVLFRVDGSSTIGVGHVARCLTLAQAFLADGATVAIAIGEESDPALVRKMAGAVAGAVATAAIVVHELPGARGSAADLEATVVLSSRIRADVVVVDGYLYGASYLRRFRDERIFSVYLDDLMDRRIGTHVVLNQNLFATAERIECDEPCERLLGPSFALVRDEILAARAARNPARASGRLRVLVTLGGADPSAETEKVIDGLGLVAAPLEVRVVVGPANARLDAIRARAEACAPHAVTVLHAITNMGEQMAWADAAVTSASTTCMELLCVGVPALSIVLADNDQRLIGPELDRRGVIRCLGWRDDVSAALVGSALADLLADPARRETISRAQRDLIDGQGKRRAVEGILRAYARFRGDRARP